MASASLRVRRSDDGRVVCERLTLGESFSQRFFGLMGRASIPEGDGLYLRTSSIHMMFMRFPIDALFVSKAEEDGTRRVVATREHLPAWRGIVLPVRGAEGVVEMRAGTLKRWGVGTSDRVVFEPVSGSTSSEVSEA